MEKNDNSWDSMYLDPKKFPYIKSIDRDLVPAIPLPPPTGQSFAFFIDMDYGKKNNRILVIPDIHGRTFWLEKKDDVDKYSKVIFLGDYLDPYLDEDITVEDAIENFKEIIEFKKNNMDKVILLLGNHDMPYYSEEYFNNGSHFSRWSLFHHKEIEELFRTNKDLFTLVYIQDDIIFSHAGFRYSWLDYYVNKVVKTEDGKPFVDITDINSFLNINKLLDMEEVWLLGIMSDIRAMRFARSDGSCIWADIEEYEYKDKLFDYKQVFGHTCQYDLIQIDEETWKSRFTDPVVHDNIMMLDNGIYHEIDPENFKLINYANTRRIINDETNT